MKKLIVVMLVLTEVLVGGCASIIPHPRPWTNGEKMLAAFFIAAHTADAYTTERGLDNPRYYETNSIMGKHPSDGEIGCYFSLTGVGTLVIAHLYPELRKPLLTVYGGVSTYGAVHNWNTMR